MFNSRNRLTVCPNCHQTRAMWSDSHAVLETKNLAVDMEMWCKDCNNDYEVTSFINRHKLPLAVLNGSICPCHDGKRELRVRGLVYQRA